jgi:hypothetical protein
MKNPIMNEFCGAAGAGMSPAPQNSGYTPCREDWFTTKSTKEDRPNGLFQNFVLFVLFVVKIGIAAWRRCAPVPKLDRHLQTRWLKIVY